MLIAKFEDLSFANPYNLIKHSELYQVTLH